MNILTDWTYCNNVSQVMDHDHNIPFSWRNLDPDNLHPSTGTNIYTLMQVTEAGTQAVAPSLVTKAYRFDIPHNATITSVEARVTRSTSTVPDINWVHFDKNNSIDNEYEYPPLDGYDNIIRIRSRVNVTAGSDSTVYLKHDNWGNFYERDGELLTTLTPAIVNSWGFQYNLKMATRTLDGSVMDDVSSLHIKDIALRVEYFVPSNTILQVGTV